MRQPIQLDSVFDNTGHMPLAHNVFECLGSEFSGDHLIHGLILVSCEELFKKKGRTRGHALHTHTAYRLPLLPSGPDGVHSAVLHETWPLARPFPGGERGIRTLGTTFGGTRDFQSRPFGLSGISPDCRMIPPRLRQRAAAQRNVIKDRSR